MAVTKEQGIEYYVLAANIRGTIINAITTLERMIDTFLAKHFSNDESKQMELITSVFATKFITYENKRLILKNVLDTSYKEHAKANFPDLHAKLDKFGKYRNELAHYIVDGSDDAVENYLKTQEVIFYQFHNSINEVKYTKKQADEISLEIYSYSSKVIALL